MVKISKPSDPLFREFLEEKIANLPYDAPILVMGEDEKWCSDIFFCRGYHQIQLWKTDAVSTETAPLNFPNIQDHAYGCIIFRDILGRFEEPQSALREICRALKPGGLLILTSPFGGDIESSNGEYFRLTPIGIKFLLKKHFQDVNVVAIGEQNRPLSVFCTARKPGPLPASKLPIDIVMLTYNRLKYLEQTIAALFERTTYPFRLTVVDNASKSDVREYLENNREKFHQLIK